MDQVGLVATRCAAAPARFGLQLTKTARALAMVNHLHEKLFAVALAAERQMSEFSVQYVANTAWAFVPVNHLQVQLSAALAIRQCDQI